MRVGLFVTCVVDLFDPDVGVATVKLLRAAGHDVVVPSGQTCCGQPAWNSGFANDAAKVARTTLDALARAIGGGVDAIVAPAGSCTTMVRVFWPELFEVAGDHAAAAKARTIGAKVFELTEFFERFGAPPLVRRDETVAYHHSCHMLRELRITSAPTALLEAAGCEIQAWSADQRCCGFGGLFSFKLPETSEAMADDKLTSLPGGTGAGATNAPAASGNKQTIVGADGSCLLHLRARAEHEGVPVDVRHIARVLADRIDGRAAAAPQPGAARHG